MQNSVQQLDRISEYKSLVWTDSVTQESLKWMSEVCEV